MNFPYNWCKNLLYLCFLLNLFVFNNCVKLRGVTLESWPYADKYEDGNGDVVWEGFVIDLIEKISKLSGFDYELYDVPDGRYGVYDPQTGRIDGMIGELHNNRADFAVGDLTVTEDAKRFVEFTQPFMSLSIAAIVNKKYGQGLQTFSDLYYSNLSYGLISRSATHHYFYNSKDSILRKMYTAMDKSRGAYVRNRLEGIDRVNTTAYAFISESPTLEFEADVNCDLMVIYDKNNEFRDSQMNYAIALKNGSKYLNGFNFALNKLNETGQLEELIDNYWVDECNRTPLAEVDINTSYPLDLLSINTYLVMFLITGIVFNSTYFLFYSF